MEHKAEPPALAVVRELNDEHRVCGEKLWAACKGELFPCDGLAFAVLDRSLNLVEGFALLVANHGYICAVAILRMQLDNILRFYGVIGSADPHGVAQLMIEGTPIQKIKDRAGRPMTDRRLLEKLGARNPDLLKIYERASAYVHLSEQHLFHFMARSQPGADGRRIFGIGNNDDHLTEGQPQALVSTFGAISRGVLSVVGHWADQRHKAGSLAQLRQRFQQAM